MQTLTKLSRWLRGLQKTRAKDRRFRPSFEALERRECPALYEWTYPVGGPVVEGSWFTPGNWRVNGAVPTTYPGQIAETDDVYLGAGAKAMDCRVGDGSPVIRNLIITEDYLATLSLRWGGTLTVKNGANSLLRGGWIEINGVWTSEGTDNHSHGNIVFDNAQVAWTGTDIGGRTITPDDYHEWNREGNITLTNGSVITATGRGRKAWAEWNIDNGLLHIADGIDGGIYFNKYSKAYNNTTGTIRWSNTATISEGSFFVEAGNLAYLTNYGKIERNVALTSFEHIPGEIKIEFPIANVGDGEVNILSGDLRLDPKREDVGSIEGGGKLRFAVGTVTRAVDPIWCYYGLIELVNPAQWAHGTNAVILGDVYVLNSTIDLTPVAPISINPKLTVGNWWIQGGTEILTRTYVLSDMVYGCGLEAYQSFWIEDNCYVICYNPYDMSAAVGRSFALLQTVTLNGEVWDGPITGGFQVVFADWDINEVYAGHLYVEWAEGQMLLKVGYFV